MRFLSRRLISTVVACASLVLSAMAPIALATTNTSPHGALTAAVASDRPLIYERVNPLNIHNEIVLGQQAVRLRSLAAKVAATPADARYRSARSSWVSGVRLEARGNLGIIAGLHAKSTHDYSLYRTDVVKGRDTLREANALVRRAEASLDLRLSSPAYFVYCGRDRCPAG